MEKFRKNRKKTATISSVLMLTIAATLIICLTTVNADEPTPINTSAYLSVAPNPIGVGQTLLVNMWISPPLPEGGLLYHDLTVKITDPDGNSEIIGPIESYIDGSAWFTYMPEKIGTWKFVFSYPGETFPAGYIPSLLNDAIYLPCTSPILELIVQEDAVPSWPAAELPKDYWTRPISAENREWYTISGDWHMTGYNASTTNFNPYSTAPGTAHILWTRQTTIGGLVGGEYGTNARYYGFTHVSVTIGGLGYYIEGGRTHCIDLRTGNELWVQTGIVSSFGAALVSKAEASTFGGGGPATTTAYTAYLMNIGSSLKKWDAYTGDLVCDVPGMGGTYNDPYVYSVQTKGTEHYLIKWTTDGSSDDFSSRIIYNVTYPLAGVSGIWADTGIYYDIAQSHTGELLPHGPCGAFNTETGEIRWMRNMTEMERRYVGGPATIADGIYLYSLYHSNASPSNLRVWAGVDLYTGDQLYISEAPEYPWGDFWGYTQAVAYGHLYTLNYDGHVYAYNIEDGTIEWKYYSGDAGYETPFGHWPFFYSVSVADGKVYAVNTEHWPNSPLFRGSKLHCIDAYTGASIWNISFFGYFDFFAGPPVIADGYLLATNWYDNQIYCFGKGQTCTTVEAPDMGVPLGSSVMIRGTVTDQSPGAKGTPAISDEDMSEWMEYLYMQKPIPADAKGVTVTLDSIDPNGNFIHIGTTTSNMDGTYGFMWTPEIEGKYEIIATLEGSKSYYSSYDTTYLGVTEAPSPAQPIEPEPTEPTEAPLITTEIAIIIAVVVVAIIGIVSYWALRKRK